MRAAFVLSAGLCVKGAARRRQTARLQSSTLNYCGTPFVNLKLRSGLARSVTMHQRLERFERLDRADRR